VASFAWQVIVILTRPLRRLIKSTTRNQGRGGRMYGAEQERHKIRERLLSVQDYTGRIGVCGNITWVITPTSYFVSGC
jgi:hypothetical protein